MEITAISGTIGFQTYGSVNSAERISTRIIKNRDVDGDSRLNVEELGSRAEILNKVDTNGDNFADQEELFSALKTRLEENSNITIEISLNINVIKASLGSLLADFLDRSASDTQTGLSADNRISNGENQINSDLSERYINALITAGIDDGGVFSGSSSGLSSTSEVRDSLNSLPARENDGRQLLLNLLIDELGTPQDEASSILSTLQSQPFQIIA
ncbi:MAG: hypothetical protein ACN4GW_06395 [Desulforhopalus sp.]